MRIKQSWLWLSGLGYHLALGSVLMHAQLRYGFLANPLAAPPSAVIAEGYAAFVRTAMLSLALVLGIGAALIGLWSGGPGRVWLGLAVLAGGVVLTAMAFATLPGGHFVDGDLVTSIWRLWLSGGAYTYVGTFLVTYCLGTLWQRRRGARWVTDLAD